MGDRKMEMLFCRICCCFVVEGWDIRYKKFTNGSTGLCYNKHKFYNAEMCCKAVENDQQYL